MLKSCKFGCFADEFEEHTGFSVFLLKITMFPVAVILRPSEESVRGLSLLATQTAVSSETFLNHIST